MSNLPPPPPPLMPGVLPLPPGWTEHKAPDGRAYYYHAQSKTSTYVRPLPPLPVPMGFPVPPVVAAPVSAPQKEEKKEKPKKKQVIEGTDWLKVTTNKGNVFYTNTVTKKSIWTVPSEVAAVLEGGAGKPAPKGSAAKAPQSKGPAPKATDTAESSKKRKEEVKEQDDETILIPKKRKTQEAPPEDAGDDDEAWQREIAANYSEETPAASVSAETATPVPDIELSKEEAAAVFKAMLAEKDIDPMAPWDMELAKFVTDARYKSVKTLSEREDLFNEFCKEKIRARRAAARQGGEKKKTVDRLGDFRALLVSTVTSTRTTFTDFKNAHGRDSRFRDFGQADSEREKVFRAFLKELGERKRADNERAEEQFREMLREDRAISPGDAWATVKTRHNTDPRYAAVASSARRQRLFEGYVENLGKTSGERLGGGDAPSNVNDLDGAGNVPPKDPNPPPATDSKAEALRKREALVAAQKHKTERENSYARRELNKEEGEVEFRTLLIDRVREHDLAWPDAQTRLRDDPRYSESPLSGYERENLYREHQDRIRGRRVGAAEALFEQHAPSLTTPFDSVLPSVSDAIEIQRVVGTDYRRLEELFEAWQKKRYDAYRREFDELLRENPLLKHWGRLKKEAVTTDEAPALGNDGSDEEDEDVKKMAQQIDEKAIKASLTRDKRYLVFDHIPEERDAWIKEYMDNLAAPKLTVYQKE